MYTKVGHIAQVKLFSDHTLSFKFTDDLEDLNLPFSMKCILTTDLLDNAIFSPTSVHTGVVRPILAKSALTAMTLPPVDREPMLTIKTSLFVNFCTFAAFLSPSVLTPRSLLRR